MIKVGFYLDNDTISSVDCTCILKGNPGIGGTEYMVIAVAQLLTIRSNDIQVKLFAPQKGLFPKELDCTVVASFQNAIKTAEQEQYDYFVFKHNVERIFDSSLEHVISRLKLIVWCHVFTCYWELDYYANNPAIYQIVHVGREQNDLYRDHKSFQKSSYIYNCVPLDDIKKKVENHPYHKRRNIVTYIGSVVPFKGLHLLAMAWPEILRQVPDAELYIIGSGKLYSSHSTMGQYGIAEENYEKLLLKYLSHEGKILPSVHFMGIMGKEKEAILLQTKVGVPNPSGITETFGLSAVEMQMLGANVTTIRCPGYLDTVVNGVLYSNRKKLAENVVYLLNHNINRYEEGINYFEANFSHDAVATRWEHLLCNGFLPADKKTANLTYRCKYAKEGLRRLKRLFPFLYALPPLERVLLFLEKKMHGYGNRYIDSNI